MSIASSAKITSRELEIVRRMADGESTKEIAAALGISKKTVDNHRINIFRKTGCKNFAHVVATFIRTGQIA